MSGQATTTVASQGQAARRAAMSRGRENLTGWVFAFPFVAIFLVFLAGPIIATFLMSFTDFGLRDLRNPLGADWIGVKNYTNLLEDKKFLRAILNTTYFVVAGLPLTIMTGLLVAIGLNQGLGRLTAFFRVGYYLPVVTSIVAIAVVWRYLVNPDLGLINRVLGLVGLEGYNWLGNPALAMPTIIAMAVWRNLGSTMVIFLAGLQTIPKEMYEAAHIDGAGRWAAFRHITLPLLRPTMLFAVVITSIGYLQLFEEPFVMTKGGPLDRTLSVSMYLYQQGFNFFHQGYASAMAYILFAAIVVLAIVQFRLLRPQA